MGISRIRFVPDLPLVRRLGARGCLGVCALLLPFAAAGEPSGRAPGGQSPDQPALTWQPMPPPAMPREKRLQWVTDSDGGAAQRAPRMTRDERRELRREIHDAGQELYPHRRQRRGGE